MREVDRGDLQDVQEIDRDDLQGGSAYILGFIYRMQHAMKTN